ncbi:MAG: thiamine phosphate synthase [Myxococcota bacterium]
MADPLPRFYVILDIASARSAGHTVVEVARSAFEGGARLFQCRFKELEDAENEALCREVVEAVGDEAVVLVNGRAEVAAAVGADGVHLTSTSGAVDEARELGARVVGRSCHTLDEARAAQDAGADFITISPVFSTSSKPGYGPILGLEGLHSVCEAIDMPVYALAGITPARVAACREAGAYGVAAMSGVCGAADVGGRIGAYLGALRG